MAIEWLARKWHWSQSMGVGMMFGSGIQIPFLLGGGAYRGALFAAALFLLSLALYFSTWIYGKIARKNVVL